MLSVSLGAAEPSGYMRTHTLAKTHTHKVVMWLAVTLCLTGCIYEMFRKGLHCRKLCQIPNTTPHQHKEKGT